MPDIDVELRNVTKEFLTRGGNLVRAVDNISLQISDGEFFALLGPSGCGKTTTLRMIAGFEDTSSGEILIRGQAVQHVPPFHRPVNTVFQDYALFPHMTVLKNVMFGLEMSGVPKNVAKQRSLEALELVRLPQASDRKPRQLSGGQQQRVALARALVNEPAVLLLDEPLGALDLKLRKAMQFELKAMQQKLGITFIYVTHDQEEALTMADRIAVMDQGKVLQCGRPEEIYDNPATRFVADFIGETNFLPGKVVSKNGKFAGVSLDDKTIVEGVIGDATVENGAEVTLAIRPEKVTIYGTDEVNPITGSNEDTPKTTLLEGVVHQTFYIGTDTRYIVLLGDKSEIAVRMQNYGRQYDTIYKSGQRVNVFWDNDNARILTQ
jgi:spermidine/putrescine transport system ATP-binding protein